MWKKHKRFWKKANDLFSRLHTLVNDIVFPGHPGDVGIGGDAEVAGWLWGASAHDTSGYSNVLNKLTRAVGKDYITAEPESSAVLPWLHLQQRQPAPGPAIPSWWSKSEHPADTLWRTTPPKKNIFLKQDSAYQHVIQEAVSAHTEAGHNLICPIGAGFGVWCKVAYPIRVPLELRISPNSTRRQMRTSKSNRPRYPNHL